MSIARISVNVIAADKFVDNIEQLTETLAIHPLMYPIYEYDDCFSKDKTPHHEKGYLPLI